MATEKQTEIGQAHEVSQQAQEQQAVSRSGQMKLKNYFLLIRYKKMKQY